MASIPPEDTTSVSNQSAESQEPAQGEKECFPVVGVGASAGGLEAFGRLLAHLPADTGMAFIVVQHLDPHGPSQLPDLLSRMTPLPVTKATSGLAVRPDHIYVIPPGGDLTIKQGVLQVTARTGGGGLHLPIDRLFRSLAEDRQAWAIGVVLSGAGSDGTLGLGEIKAAGGITFAQDEGSAQHPDMPRHAVDSGAVDFVLAPEAIADRLVAIGGHPLFGAESRAPAGDEAQDDEGFRDILGVVRAAAGVDFTHYRDSTLRRRIRRRIALRSSRSVTDYVGLLKEDRTEVRALYQELLITVTGFFRDPEVFEAIKCTVFPQLMAARSPTTPLRIWVPGCSTGQEPFSLAMILMEFFDDRPGQLPPIQIFATDICDEMTLQKARAGFYPKTIAAEVSPERLRRFFQKENGAYRIDKSIRDLCVFARQDVTADPPFSHLDLISCRNVLIYFAAPLQKRVLPLFHYALNAGGFLVLGPAESVGEHTDLFGVADRNRKIFAKKTPGVRRVVDFMGGSPLTARVRGQSPSEPAPVDFQREADRLLLRHYAPPGVLVDENFDIVQFRGRTGLYIESPPGEPTTNLFKMAREGLFTDLRSAFAEVVASERPARREGVRLSKNGESRVIGLEVIPVRSVATEARCFLVLFHEAQPPFAKPHADDQAVAPVAAALEVDADEAGAASDPERTSEAVRLRQELAATKEYLQSLMEQQDATNEELRSANEEISSSNEELQSINEELETAKEELQSTNEELKTVNEQIEHRNRELNAVNNDLVNLLSSTHIPIIMVGRDLRIRRFTESARKALDLATTDAGRPIRDTHPVVRVPDLEELIGKVIDEVRPIEREVQDRDDRWYALRIRPYWTLDHKVDGAVVILLDIDKMRRADLALRATEERMRSVVDNVLDAVMTMDETGSIESFNPAAERLFGYDCAEAVGHKGALLIPEAGNEAAERDGEHRGTRPADVTGGWREAVGRRKDGSTFPIELAVGDFHIGSERRFTWIVRDISERKRLEAELRGKLAELDAADRRKDEFLATLAHELRNPLTPISTSLQLLQRTDAGGPPPKRVYGMLERQVNHMNRLVEDLLDVSRITRGSVELRMERVELADIVQSAVETSRPLIEEANQQLDVSLPAEPIVLEADSVRLAQVFANLLNNAANYSDKGGKVRLSARVDRGAVVISVRDTGIGIEKEMLDHIFEMFNRGTGASGYTRNGLGIGLTLVRSLVELHGGSVAARSEGLGKGSEFVVRLPVALDPAPESPQPEHAGDAAAIRHRVLLVDDNRDLVDSLGMLLTEIGATVQVAYDGPAALELLETYKPDAAFLDIGLPEMDGYELARRIRAHPRHHDLMLIALTGWDGEEDRRRSKEAGFDHHLLKPVDINALCALLETLGQS